MVILIFLFSGRCFSQEIPRIIFSEKGGNILVDQCDGYLLHLLSQKNLTDEDWQNLLAIYVTDKKTGEVLHDLPMLGQYAIINKKIYFNPRLPFRDGINYLAKFNIPYFYALVEKNMPLFEWQKVIELYFKTANKTITGHTVINKVYPDSDTLPVNQLKLYIHFSNPMREGVAYEHIQILDESGKSVDQPFLELSPELWDGESKRLTVWFDPGRIKRGLNPNALKGLPLKQGYNYTLKINPGWKDKTGRPIEATYEKRFYISEPDRKAPVISNWVLHIPAGSTKAGLSIQFDEPMDHALLNRMIRITNEGKGVTGKVKISNQEKTWTFEPHEPWNSTNYQIRINTKIEDLAGNSLRRLFDTPVSDTGQGSGKEKELIIPVKVSTKIKNKKVRKYQFRTLPN